MSTYPNDRQSAQDMIIEDIQDLIQDNAEMANSGEPEQDQYPIGDRAWHVSYVNDQVGDLRHDGIYDSDSAWALWVYYTILEGLTDPKLTDERYAELVAEAYRATDGDTPSLPTPTND